MDRLDSLVVIAPARRAETRVLNPGPGENFSLKLLRNFSLKLLISIMLR